EPSRLACKVNGVDTYGFLCPNFENQSQQTVREQLDQLRPNDPVLVTSESGHIVYANSNALNKLNICNVSGISPPPTSATSKAKNATKPGAKTGAKSNPTSTTSSGSPACKLVSSTSGCYKPVVNPVEETKLARTGQLDEDLAIYAIEKVENLLAADYSGGSKEKTIEFFANQIQSSLSLYSQLGYTTVQEGAASKGLIETYMAAATSKPLPATMAFLEYDGTTVSDFACSVGNAQSVQAKLSSEGYDMFVAGMKAFADGSNQGYTGAMASPVFYMNRNKP